MKTGTLHRLSPTTALAALLAALSPGLASADNFVGTDFQAVAATSQRTSEFDYGAHGYRKLNLSVIGNIAWVPMETGAQGPLRESMDAGMTDSARQAMETDKRFYPIGGRNTP